MSSAEASTDGSAERVRPNSFANVCGWLLLTLVGAGLLAFLAGSATPRARLLFLFPLAIGAFVAYAAMWLLERFHLEMKGWMIGWVILLAAGVPAGSAFQSWRLWQADLRDERVAFMQQINRMMENAENKEEAQAERRKLLLAFREQTSFPSYLTHRLVAFSRQVGRRDVWAPPVPEILFTFELFLAAVAALFLCLHVRQSATGPPEPGDATP